MCLACARLPAQAPQARPPVAPAPGVVALPRVFLDCATCDGDYLRQALAFVNLVRDRQLADVHALVTTMPTGDGGREYSLELTGRRDGRLRSDSARALAPPQSTEQERRELVARALRVALIPFLRGHPVLARIDVAYVQPEEDHASPSRGEDDPWRQWVFTIGGSGSLDGDDNYASYGAQWNVAAARVTPAIKVNAAMEGEWSRARYALADGGTLVGERRRWAARTLVARSLGEHAAAGVLATAGSSLFENTRLQLAAMLAVEYNLLPYAEATQRQLLVRLAAGARAAQYVDTTVFGKLRETRPLQELTVLADFRRRWGDATGRARWSEYLHDRSKRRVTVDVNVSRRLVAGLTVFGGGSYAVTRDQLNLAGVNLTDEERLLRLRELRSGSSFVTGFGLSYTFGSAFSNVVNPRFGS